MNSGIRLLLLSSILMSGSARAALLVDFSDNASNVAPDAAGFIVASGSVSPQSAVFLAGTQGYSLPPMDTGAGINVSLRVYSATAGSFINLLQLRDRNDAAADLASDWAFQGGTFDGDMARIGLRLTLTGLMSGNYNFSSLHVDSAGTMGGVMDAQYSTNGGLTWNDTIYDNASFTGGLNVELHNIAISEASGLQVRYLVGGNLFGTAGVARSGDMNFLLPHNSFLIAPVPEPSTALLALSAIPSLLIRRR